MSSCLRGGGGRAYGFDLDIIKCPSPPTRSSHSSPSSPSSTLSENSNSVPLAISTKKARTPRKRPNQTYTEAAALLSKIYPNIFSTTNLRKHCKFTRPHDSLFLDTSELLPPFPGLSDAGFLLHHGGQLVLPDKQNSLFELKYSQNSISPKCCSSRNQSYAAGTERTYSIDDGDDFDTESILDEEIGEGIDSIMGNLSCGEDETSHDYSNIVNPYLGHLGCGRFQTNVTRALRSIGNGEWWCSSPTVEMQNIVPELKKSPPSPSSSPALLLPEKKKKKKKKTVSINSKDAKPNSNSNVNSKKDDKFSKSEAVVEKSTSSPTSSSSSTTSAGPSSLKPALSLKLNYDCVMKEWAGRGTPFSEASESSESPADIIARLSDIDLLSEVAGSGGLREASVLRYKEKRRSRLFSKKIGYQVRKVNADRRPRAKGKFSTTDAEE